MSSTTEKKPLLIQIPGEITPNLLPTTASAVGYDFVQGNYIYYATGSDSWVTAPVNENGYWQSTVSNQIYTSASLVSLEILSASNGATITGSLRQGFNIVASAPYSHAQGSGSLASATGSHAEGFYATGSGQYSHAEGYYGWAQGLYSHAEGYQTNAISFGGHAEGAYTTAGTNNFAHAEGYSTTANGYASHTEGLSTTTTTAANYGHAEGRGTTVSGDSAHAEGQSTTASGYASHAEGYYASSPGYISHAEGYYTVASGAHSHAEGYYSTTYGPYSHASGLGSIAYSSGSFSAGNEAEAVGIASFAAGTATIASGSGQVAIGKYNQRNNDSSLFVIGDGVGVTNQLRGDILRVNSGSIIGNGRVEVTGSLAATRGLSGSLTKLVDGTSYIIAGSGISVSSASNGAVTISATGGSGLATGKQYLAAATTTTTTTALMIGQFAWVPADYTGLTSVRVRAIMSTDGTANHTGSLQIYNLTSGSYLDLVNTPSTGKHFTVTSSIPTLVTSSNLLTGITNFNNSSTSVYEVRVSGSSANNTIIGGVELIFS